MDLDLAEEFGSDETAEVEGVWVPLGSDAAVKVARLGNPDAQAAYKRIPRIVRRQIEEGTMTAAQSRKFLVSFVAKNLLKDWKNLSDGGKTVKYSIEAAEKMLRKHRRFQDRIWELASDEDLFNVHEVEEDAKNSPKLSGGT